MNIHEVKVAHKGGFDRLPSTLPSSFLQRPCVQLVSKVTLDDIGGANAEIDRSLSSMRAMQRETKSKKGSKGSKQQEEEEVEEVEAEAKAENLDAIDAAANKDRAVAPSETQ